MLSNAVPAAWRGRIQQCGDDHGVGGNGGNGEQEDGLVHIGVIDTQHRRIEPPEAKRHQRPDHELAGKGQAGKADIPSQPRKLRMPIPMIIMPRML